MSDKERLDGINDKFGNYKTETIEEMSEFVKDFHWLIEQAEQKQHMEMKYENTGSVFGRQNQLMLIEENKKLREVLEFYANSENYQVNVVDQWAPEINIMKDGGSKAHQTLEELK